MKEVNASIITIGDELLIGQTIDTNSAFIAQELNGIGIWVKRRIAVGDLREEIIDSLKEQSTISGVIIITGGLGPTADDITKPVLCEFFGGKLVMNEEALQNVRDIFARLGRPLTDRNIRQAEVPSSCEVLPNNRGTAPGMWFEKDGTIYISLPGVPHEMKGLMTGMVIPRLKKSFPLPAVVHRSLLTAGIGESMIADRLVVFESQLPAHIKLAYLPSYGLVKLMLTGRGNDKTVLESEVNRLFESLKREVKEWMVADSDRSLAGAVSDLLRKHGRTVSTAESCTGGYIAHLITTQPGSSQVFNGTVVAYANQAKMDLLEVQPEVLNRQGAVSAETVEAMARAVLKKMRTDYAIATSGIMGPDGGTPEKPVGTVWIAVANTSRSKTIKQNFRFDRMRNIELTAHAGLTLLFRFISEQETNPSD